MTDVRAVALHFEAVSLDLFKRNPGPIFKLRIHPQEMPKELWDHPLGTRYMVALVPLADDGQPQERPQTPAGQVKTDRVADAKEASDREAHKKSWHTLRLSQRAGIICNEPLFWEWANCKVPIRLKDGYAIIIDDPKSAADWLRWKTAVNSRGEYDTDEAAGRRYLEIERSYAQHKESLERP